MQDKTNNNGSDIVVLKFADAQVPVFKEVRNKDYILYGKNNLYPEYLTELYNKSSKHGAIINGKTKYIYGGGFISDTNQQLEPINRRGETWADITPKMIKDVEIYGGYKLLIIWNKLGTAFEIFHVDFQCLRAGKDGGFWYKENWANSREEAIPYEAFTPDGEGVQIYEYNEYRPGTNIYPLPEYIACNNYIETDIEISKFHLSAIKNGMMPSKLIQFFDGVNVTEDKKKEIEKRWKSKFSGSENAGKFVLVFNSSKDKSVEISDLSASELDKQFDILNKTCEQEIFTGHQVTSPMLFGIKTEGQLGGSTELKTAYEIFINTYAKNKQANIERVVNYLNGVNGKTSDYKLTQLDPVGFQFNIDSVISLLPKEFIFEKLNVPKEYWQSATVNDPASTQTTGAPQAEGMVNEAIKTLTAKQHQQLMRIMRQYAKGQLTLEQAQTMMRAGYGLSDEDINTMLGVQQEFSAEDEDSILALFDACGEDKNDYTLLKSKRVSFSSVDEAFDDEIEFYQQSFKTGVSIKDADILSLINKDRKATPEVIADALGVTPAYVTARIGKLVDRGLLQTKTETIGTDTVIERTLTKPLRDITETIDAPVSISIKYSYEGPQDSRNRPFCAKMMKLNRYYTRAEIEQISQRLGYSVFDRRGGFWRHKDGEITPYCRHRWESHVVVKKIGGAK